MNVESAIIEVNLTSARLIATAKDLQRITKNGHPQWIREARLAYQQADRDHADAHLDLEYAVNQELSVRGVRV